MIQRTLRADTLLQSMSVAVVLAIVCRIVAFGRGVLLTRTLTPEELGTWALVANAVALLAFVCTLGVPNGLARYSERYRNEDKLAGLFLTTMLRTGAVTVVICLAGIALWQPLGRILFDDGSNPLLVWVTLGAVAVTVVLSLVQGMLQGLRLFRLNSCVELGQNVAFLILAAVLFGVWQGSALVAAWANLLTTLIAAVLIGVWLIRAVAKFQGDRSPATGNSGQYWWPILAYSLGAWGAGSLQALWRVIDRYMLLHLSSAGTAETLDQIGQYYIASKLAGPLGALAGVVSMALLPHAAKLWEANRRDTVSDMVCTATKLAAVIMTFAGALLLALQGWIIPLVTGRTASMTAAVLAPVLLTVIAVSIHFILRTYLMCREQAWSVTGIWIVTLLTNAGFNLVLIPRYELVGAAWATMLSGTVAVGLTAALSKTFGMRLGSRLIICLCMPCLLLLPVPLMAGFLAVAAVTTHYTDWILSREEKQFLNQTCSDRLGRYFRGRIGTMLAPQPA